MAQKLAPAEKKQHRYICRTCRFLHLCQNPPAVGNGLCKTETMEQWWNDGGEEVSLRKTIRTSTAHLHTTSDSNRNRKQSKNLNIQIVYVCKNPRIIKHLSVSIQCRLLASFCNFIHFIQTTLNVISFRGKESKGRIKD